MHTELDNLSVRQIIDYLETKRSIYIPIMIERAIVEEITNKTFTDREWADHTEDWQEIYFEEIADGFYDEVADLLSTGE